MKNNCFKGFAAVLLLVFLSSFQVAAQYLPDKKVFQNQYDLTRPHSLDIQYYTLDSRLTKIANDGTKKGTDIYRLYLRCVPAAPASKLGDDYTCLKFTYQSGNSPEKTIPSLTNWEYHVKLKRDAKDSAEPLFGIDQSKFENLVDDSGKEVPIENQFHIYNAFVDFYSMFVFADKPDSGRGVQDLKQVGDKVIHAASFSQPEENLGSRIAKGSYFKNGEITLEFKGLGNVNNKPCALIGYDSGASSFYMIMKPVANIEIKTRGSSHYFGDIYKDLAGGWIQKATLHEFVVSQSQVPGLADKVNGIVERTIMINNVPAIH